MSFLSFLPQGLQDLLAKSIVWIIFAIVLTLLVGGYVAVRCGAFELNKGGTHEEIKDTAIPAPDDFDSRKVPVRPRPDDRKKK